MALLETVPVEKQARFFDADEDFPMNEWRFDQLDPAQTKIIVGLRPGRRVWLMLSTQQFTRNARRGRLRQLYPDLSRQEIGCKLLEENQLANYLSGRFQPVF